MKLRIQGNSLRLRLSEAEVKQFGQTGLVEEVILFGPAEDQKLSYLLEKSAEATALTVNFAANKVTVLVPANIATEWVNTEQNGFDGYIPNGTEKGLKILVDKDLDCSHQ